MKITSKFLLIVFTTFLNIQNLSALENKILFKIDNEIITTLDIHDEVKFP